MSRDELTDSLGSALAPRRVEFTYQDIDGKHTVDVSTLFLDPVDDHKYKDVMDAWLEQARAQPPQWVSPTDFDSDVKFSPFDKAVYAVYDEARELLLRKHADYGPKNISGSPGGPLNGLRVRAWDKMARINNLIDSGAEPEHESLRDSFLDLANYALIGLLVIDENWPTS